MACGYEIWRIYVSRQSLRVCSFYDPKRTNQLQKPPPPPPPPLPTMPIPNFSPMNDRLSVLPYLDNDIPSGRNNTVGDLESALPLSSFQQRKDAAYGHRISTFGWTCCAILSFSLSIWGTVGIVLEAGLTEGISIFPMVLLFLFGIAAWRIAVMGRESGDSDREW